MQKWRRMVAIKKERHRERTKLSPVDTILADAILRSIAVLYRDARRRHRGGVPASQSRLR